VKKKLLLFLRLAAAVVGGALVIKIVLSTNILILKNSESILSSARQNAHEFIGQTIVFVSELIYSVPLVALLVLLGVLGCLFIRRRRLSRHLGKPATHQQTLRKDTLPTCPPATEYVPELVGLKDVEAFFLELYRRQLGATLEARGFITSTQDKNNRAGRVYNLNIKHNGQWETRHMTIRPIGEVTHSKSQCFYVIFDTHMVVKIPPVPMKDFSDYICRIQRESTLVEKLAPMICIIPNVSVILSRIRKLVGVGAIPAIGQEEKYIRFLKAAPEYQTCFKIGGAFAFFMDLSRHYFLSYVLAELHDVEGEIQKIIASDAAVMLNGFDFETKYGPKNAQICLDLQEMYGRFESRLTTCLIQPNEHLKLSDKQKREWFFSHLAGETISRPASPDFSEPFMTEVRRLLRGIATPSEPTVRAYKKIVSDYAGHLVFNQNRPQYEQMVTSLLDLLVFLEERRICLRDLKPDNLLVAGKTENYPLFLLSADDYSIGLIDMETAVEFRPSGNQPLLQPHLAGTPAYATPSHFAMNGLLLEIYSNLPWVLHLQDWYAIVGIIYEIIIGGRLFLSTGSQIPIIIQTLQQALADRRDLKEVYLALNGAFWRSAMAEFIRKTKEYELRLDKVMVRVPIALKSQFTNYLSAQPGNMNQFLLSDRPNDLSFTLTAKHLLERMFEIVAGTLDRKDVSTRNTHKKVADVFSEYQSSEYATCSIGYTLPGEIQKDKRHAGV
jgi:serine/threonine protein kinase